MLCRTLRHYIYATPATHFAGVLHFPEHKQLMPFLTLCHLLTRLLLCFLQVSSVSLVVGFLLGLVYLVGLPRLISLPLSAWRVRAPHSKQS